MNKYAEHSRAALQRLKQWRMCERKRAYQCPHCGKYHRSGSLATLAAKVRGSH